MGSEVLDEYDFADLILVFSQAAKERPVLQLDWLWRGVGAVRDRLVARLGAEVAP